MIGVDEQLPCTDGLLEEGQHRRLTLLDGDGLSDAVLEEFSQLPCRSIGHDRTGCDGRPELGFRGWRRWSRERCKFFGPIEFRCLRTLLPLLSSHARMAGSNDRAVMHDR